MQPTFAAQLGEVRRGLGAKEQAAPWVHAYDARSMPEQIAPCMAPDRATA